MTSRFNKQGRWLVGLIAFYVLGATGVNTLVNPLRMEPAAVSIEALDPYREIGEDLRTGKAGLVRYHRDVEVAIVGSSRFEIGIDPLDSAFGGAKVLNVAMAAAEAHENVAMTRYLMAREPHLRELIFGLDLGDISGDLDSRKITSFYTSPLADKSVSLDREIRHVIGIGALEESFLTLSHFIRRQTTSHSPLGLWLTPRHPRNIRNYLITNNEDIFHRVPDMCEMRPQLLRAVKLEKLRALFIDLRSRGVKVLVTIPPQLAIKQLHPSLDMPPVAPWDTDRRAIYGLCCEVNAMNIPGTPLMQLWDFATFNEQTCVALPPISGAVQQVPHWFDMGHFDPTIGGKMVKLMMGQGVLPADQPLSERFGVNVLKEGIEEHLKGLRVGHARYCREHSDDVAWARSIFPKFNREQSGAASAADDETE